MTLRLAHLAGGRAQLDRAKKVFLLRCSTTARVRPFRTAFTVRFSQPSARAVKGVSLSRTYVCTGPVPVPVTGAGTDGHTLGTRRRRHGSVGAARTARRRSAYAATPTRDGVCPVSVRV